MTPYSYSLPDPIAAYGIIPGHSRIEVKWFLGDNEVEESSEVWWSATVYRDDADTTGRVFTLVYDPMPSIGFPTADVRRVVFHGRHSIEHLHEGEGGEMQWRFVGETLDLDAQQIDDTSKSAEEFIMSTLWAQELQQRPMQEQQVLAERIRHGMEILRAAVVEHISSQEHHDG